VSDGADPEPDPSPVRRALDLFVFAPVGVALTVAEDLPALIVKGRQRFETDVRNARLVGQFVVARGQRDVGGRVSRLLYGEPSAPGEPADVAGEAAPGAESPVQPVPVADPADANVVDAALAGYDTLSASQVVRRLESLGPDVLRAVCRHEASHRNRRTILNRAQQLLEGTEPDRPVG
jgi:hypothetical protein